MKKLLLIFFFLPLFVSAQESISKKCGTMEYLEMQKQKDPSLEMRMQKMEEQIQTWMDNNPSPLQTVIQIPTVVHVIYQNSIENIPDTFIYMLIQRLNEDFRKLNADAVNIPPAFQSIAADCEIEFCLTSKDTNGNPTNGIERRWVQFSPPFDCSDIYYTSAGGLNAWNPQQYLNIWVVFCLSSGILGYAQFPGGNPATDGVVLSYQAVPGPQSLPQYSMGRVATHEIGHWLNLYHIWGSGSCGNDNVSDTPTAEGPHYSVNGSGPPAGCPTHPYHTNMCGAGTSPNGEMWQNYMDYVDDSCMFMFTAGQKTRMAACLNGTRASLLTSAATNCNPTSINETELSNTISIFPNPNNGTMTIKYVLAENQKGRFEIYNVVGIKVTDYILQSNTETLSVSQSDLNEGIYFYRLTSNDKVTGYGKVVVIKQQ